ncbi:YIEGIA domain-containing protein, partial [Collinsella aerofaciens]
TFLALAASQFRDVRNMERNTLNELDQYELVPRGKTYIEGIAIVFEGRNYLVIFVSFLSTLFYLVWNVWAA